MKSLKFRFFLVVLLLIVMSVMNTGIIFAEEADSSTISTIAGVGMFSGDGGSATEAVFDGIMDVAYDLYGNIYIADSKNNRVRKVDANGIVETIAGDGSSLLSGMEGPAINAGIPSPISVAVNSLGEVFIANYERIFKVDSSGTVTVFAGGGTMPFTDGISASDVWLSSIKEMAFDNSGNLYFTSQFQNSYVMKIDVSGNIWKVAGIGIQGYEGDNGPATMAMLNNPDGITVSSEGEVFIADSDNNCIRKIDTSGFITTVLSMGNQPFRVVADSNNDLYISANSTMVQKLDENGVLSPVLADGFFLYGGHRGLDMNLSGELLYVDGALDLVSKLLPGGVVIPVAGGEKFSGDYGFAVDAVINKPTDVVIDPSGRILISDSRNFRIRAIDSSGIITTVSGNGQTSPAIDGFPAVDCGMSYVASFISDDYGNIYFCHNGINKVMKINASGILSTVAGNGDRADSPDGGYAVNSSLIYPYSIALDSQGNLYILDREAYKIRKVDTSGIISTVAGNGTPGHSGDGNLATDAQIELCNEIAIDSEDNLYLAETYEGYIRKIDRYGIISTIAGTGFGGSSGDGGLATAASLATPWGIAIDGSGNLYIAENTGNRIRKVDTNGIISTVVGTGISGFSGDDGPATMAMINRPEGVAVDSLGNLYVADTLNHRIRKVVLTKQYYVKYDGNGNTEGIPPVQTGYNTGDIIEIPANTGSLAKPDYLFAGWNTKEDGTGTTYMPGSMLEIGNEDITLYARWIPADFNYFINGNEVSIVRYLGTKSNIVIPDTIEGRPVTSILNMAFSRFGFITSVTIPDTVRVIGNDAFSHNQISLIELPSSLLTIGQSGFAFNSLSTVTIPDSVISIGKNAFIGTDADNIMLGSGFTDYWLVDSNIIKGHIAPDSELIIPEMIDGDVITEIDNEAFKNLMYLTSVKFPSSMSKIGADSFMNNLITSISLPDSIYEIGSSSFKNNFMSEVFIPSNATIIGGEAFSGNQPVESSFSIIGYLNTRAETYAIENGYQFIPMRTVSFDVDSGSAVDQMIIREGYPIFQSPVSTRPDYTLGGWYLESEHINKVTFPYLIEGETILYAQWVPDNFVYVKHSNWIEIIKYTGSEEAVVIPSFIERMPVTQIAEHAFYSIGSMTSIYIPESIVSIGEFAFANTSLVNVVIPDQVVFIGKNAFAGIDSDNIRLGAGVTEFWIVQNGMIYGHISPVADLIIPDREQSMDIIGIADDAFKDVGYIHSVRLPQGLSSIGNMAFAGNCIQEIEIPSTVTDIGVDVFLGNTNVPEAFTIIGIRETAAEIYSIMYHHTFIARLHVMFVDWDGTMILEEYVLPNGSAIAPVNPDRTGYTFSGWDGEYSNVVQDEIVIATYTINQYTVIFEVNGGREVESVTQDYGTLVLVEPLTKKPSSKFLGWYYDDTFTHPVVFPFVLTEDITLYALWIETPDYNNKYKIY